MHHRTKHRIVRATGSLVESMEARQLLSGTVYYVSNTGSDSNAGTSPAAPWQTAAKVNATSFSPDDQILFQRGGVWHESLTASSSGTVGHPITFADYGDTTAAKPTFLGSDALDVNSFSLVSGTTYVTTPPLPVTWVYDNGSFLRSSKLNTSNSTDSNTNLNFINSTTGSWYFNGTQLYVNLGSAPAGHNLTATVREDCVSSNGMNNLVFQNFDVQQSADASAGYAYRVQASSNVTIRNCDAELAGKHHFGVIDSTGFVGQNLNASLAAPDQGFGGASAFVSFSGASRQGDTSEWDDCTWSQPNGSYPAFISHAGITNAIASIVLKNMIVHGQQLGIYLEAAGPEEHVLIQGGHVYDSTIDVGTQNTILDGVTVSGAYGEIDLSGTADVVQNCLFYGQTPDVYSGHNGAVSDIGTNNTIRFNTFAFTTGPAVTIRNDTTNTQLYGNVFDSALPLRLLINDAGVFYSDYNVFASTPTIGNADVLNLKSYTLAQWQGLGHDTHSVVGDPLYNNAGGGDYSLKAGSPAIDLISTLPDGAPAISNDFSGNARPTGPGYDAGAFEKIIAPAVLQATATPVIQPTGDSVSATITVQLANALTVPATVNFATADATAIGNVDYTPTSGTLTFAPGVTSQTITVPVLADAGNTQAISFTVNFSSPVNITLPSSPLEVTISPAGTVPLDFDASKLATYTDAAGKAVAVKLTGPGTGQLFFAAGTSGNPSKIILANTTAKSSLVISSPQGASTLGDIDVNGSLAKLTAQANVAGDIHISGSIKSITLGNISGSKAISIGQGGAPTVLKFGNVTDISLTSAGPIASLSALSWIDADPTTAITAPSIGSIKITGGLTSSMGVAGKLGAVKVGGAIGGGTWSAAAGQSITAGSTNTSWTANVVGDLASVVVAGDLSGTLSAHSIKTLRALHDITATVRLSAGDLGAKPAVASVFAGNAISGANIRVVGNIGAVSANSISNSVIFAGTSDSITGLPTTTGAFSSQSIIKSVTVRGGPFANSDVAASTITAVNVRGVQFSNNAVPFGFAAHTLGSFKDLEAGQKPFVWNSKKPASLLTFAGDFKVSLL